MRDDMDCLNQAVRHEQPVLQLILAAVPRRVVNEVPDLVSVLRMNAS